MPMLHCKGFILFPVLILVQLTALIGLFELSMATACLKNNDHLWIRNESLRRAKHLSHMLGNKLNNNCFTSRTSATDLASKSVLWWQQNACAGYKNKLRYYYIIEPLGLDLCARVANTDYAADYYRISLLALPEAMKNAKIMLQTTVVKAASIETRCQTNPRLLMPGQQTQQEI